MKSAELKQLFDEIKNRNIGDIEKLNNDNSEAKQVVYKAIKNIDAVYDSQGFYKKCMFFGRKLQYAMLKYKDRVYNKCYNQCEESNNVIKFNNWLISKGIKTPKIHTFFFVDKKFFEIEDRVVGKSLYLSSVNVISSVLGNLPATTLNDMLYSCVGLNKKEKTLVGNNLYSYTMDSLNTLSKLDQKCFDKLVKQYAFLCNIGFNNLDINPGNIMLSEKGFTLIDLNLDLEINSILNKLKVRDNKKYTIDQVIEKMEKLTNKPMFDNTNDKYRFDLGQELIDTFCCSLCHTSLLNNSQIRDIEIANIEMLKKVVLAIAKNGYDIGDTSCIHKAVGYRTKAIKEIVAPLKELKRSRTR